MEDDNAKDDPNEATTSKKASQSNNSVDDDYNDNRGNQRINRDMSESDTYSDISDIEMARTGQEVQAASILKGDPKAQGKKKKIKRLAGRIKKRERPPPVKRQRKPLKRKPKPKEERKKRDTSVSTIFTRLSSSGFQTPGCNRCGHRCCLRRYNYELRKKYNRNGQNIRRYNRLIRRNKDKEMDQTGRLSEGAQAGSRSKMLSPLFVSSNTLPNENPPQTAMTYCEIDPDMIYEALRRLTMWKQDVPTNSILEYIAQNYPVNTEKSELMSELCNKLAIATIIGIVSRSSADTWCLGHVSQRRRPSKNHVTMFWKIHADTLRPIARRENTTINQEPDTVDKVTDTIVNTFITHEAYL